MRGSSKQTHNLWLLVHVLTAIHVRRAQIYFVLVAIGPVYWSVALLGAQSPWGVNQSSGRTICAPGRCFYHGKPLIINDEHLRPGFAVPEDLWSHPRIEIVAGLLLLCFLTWFGVSLILVGIGGILAVVVHFTLFGYVSSFVQSKARAEFAELSRLFICSVDAADQEVTVHPPGSSEGTCWPAR